MKQTQGSALFIAPTIGDVQFQTTDDSWWYCKADGVWTYVASPGMAFFKPDSIEIGDYYAPLAGGRSVKIAPEGTSAFARFFIQQTIGGNPQPAAIADPNAVLELNSNGNATNFWFSVPTAAQGGTNATFGFTTDGAFRHALTYVCADNRFSLTPDGIQASPTRGLSISGDGWLSVNKKVPDSGSMLHMYDNANFAARGMTMDQQCATAGNVFFKMRCGNTLSAESQFSLSESGTLTHTNTGNMRWTVNGGVGRGEMHGGDYGDGSETRFGIGTAGPQANLHVYADLPTTSTRILVENGTAAGSAGIRFSDDTGQVDLQCYPDRTILDVDVDDEGNPFYIQQGGNDRIVLDNVGRFGFNITNPIRRFHFYDTGPWIMRLTNSGTTVDTDFILMNSNPVAAGSYSASISSLGFENATPALWFKYGAGNSDWSRVLTTNDAAIIAKKSGRVIAASFAGVPSMTSNVVFTTPYPDTNYGITASACVSGNTAYSITTLNKATTGFTLSLNDPASINLICVDWLATPYGEVP